MTKQTDMNRYIFACCHLYGMISEDKVLMFYNKHHNTNLSNLLEHIDLKGLSKGFIHYEKGYFISEYIYDSREMSDHLVAIQCKPYYFPSLDTFMQYEDDFYHEPNRYIDALYQQLFNIVTNKNAAWTENLIESVLGLKQVNATMETILSTFSEDDISQGKIMKITPNLFAVVDHARSHINNGYSDYELKQLEIDRLKLKDTDTCLCGSDNPYATCCKSYDKIGLGNQDLFCDNPFEVKSEDIQTFKSALKTLHDKIYIHIPTLKKPSLPDMIDSLSGDFIKAIIHIEEKLVLAGLIELYYDQNGWQFNHSKKEKVYKALGMWTKKNDMPEIVEYLYSRFDELQPDIDLLKAVDLLLDDHGLSYKALPNKKPFDFLVEGIAQTKVNTILSDTIEDLAFGIYETNLEDKASIYYNLLRLYPLSLAALRFVIDFIDERDSYTILNAIIKAFEKVNEKALLKPPKDFYKTDLNRIYIEALDMVALYHKQTGEYKKAIPLYEKIIKYDDTDRFLAKESILVCYMVLNRVDDYGRTLDALPEDSVYKVYIKLYEALIYEEPFINRYITALNLYPKTMDAICFGYDPHDLDMSMMEHYFLRDFHYQMTYKKKIIQPLIDLHQSRFTK